MGTIGPIGKQTITYFPNGDRSSRLSQSLYRSKPRDFTKPLPYVRDIARSSIIEQGKPAYNRYSGADCLNFGAYPWMGKNQKAIFNRTDQTAYNKLVSKVKDAQMGWGENLATRKQAYSMMLHRVGTLTTAVRRLRRGDIPGFVKALGTTERPSRSKVKNASSLWLEYHFGWEPLYGDIHTACKILAADVPSSTLRGVGIEEVESHWRSTNSSGMPRLYSRNYRAITVMQGDYHVDNPNKFLLNQCGVINPVSVAWELVPFSFAVDWFLPVGQFLNSFTDFYGVSRTNEFTSRYITVEQSVIVQPNRFGEKHASVRSNGVMSTRTLGVSAPRPTFKLFKGFSLTRGATAVALLVGMLKSLG